MTHSPTVRIGIDAGLTLTKLAIEAEDGDIRFEKDSVIAQDLPAVVFVEMATLAKRDLQTGLLQMQ